MLITKFTLKIIFVSLFLFSCLMLKAQSTTIPFLERRISVTVVEQPVENILKQISEQVGCVFSYSPELIDVRKISTVVVRNKPMKIILNDIFENKVSYNLRRKYIILKKKKDTPKDIKTLEGYIYDKQTGSQLTEASVYDKQLGISAITNKYGYFRIEVPESLPTPSLSVSKVGYSDTLLIPSSLNLSQRMMEVNLNTNNKKRWPNNSFSKFLPKWLLPRKINIHSTNLTDSVFRKVQLSLLPMVNTNALLTGNTKNDFSINLTVGYVYAIQKCEIGAGINIVRSNAGVCQLAGAGNIVGGNSRGFQAAGGFNIARNAYGIQSAGGINIARNNANIQIAGGINIAQKSNAQLAGAINMTKDTSKVQITGGVNIVEGKATIQTAGAANVAKQANVQLSGGINLAKDSANLQMAGAVSSTKNATAQITGGVNLAQDSRLLQLSSGLNYASASSNIQIGIVNVAKHSKTLQLGIVNIADSSSGIPIGLFSYVRTGYHRLELSMDETSFVNMSFRSGVQHFHSSFSVGVFTKQLDEKLIGYGFGIGTSLGNPRKSLFDIDLSMNQFATTSKFLSDGKQFKLYCGIDRKLTQHISLALGVSYNVLTNKTTSTENQLLYSQIAPYTISNQLLNNTTNLRSWIGGKVAFRFM